ncbi:PREDICTED: tyrosine-sulfated glycopeptide receptor 1-like [Prunus mume]|uniref:Tyrosine-sulfated glycopeptide receptor 1-like n=1 Tax=Prunus mume TaxID=102107 RepID=A0ABM1LLF7_PRUMU|nr:PREDICTED: tyrosine-sulfated glycopeptide receptor 1-like [Prunus mume]
MLDGAFKGEGMPSDDDMVDFDGFQNLRLLSLFNSDLTGQMPIWLSKLKNIEILRLDFNQITRPIPEDIYNAAKLEEIPLPLNSLHGVISDKIVNLTKLAILDLYFNHFGGKHPLNLGKLSKLKFLTFDFNNLEGALPPSLMNCTNLVELCLGYNNLEGDIFMLDFSRLSQLTKLDLKSNSFTGTVPSLVSHNLLKEFDALYNNLEGPIPTGTQLQSFNASTFEGNPKLCGAPLPNKCIPNKDMDADNKNNKDEGNGHHQLPWFYIIIVYLGFILGFW